MCKEQGDFGGKSYEETQRIGAGFAEMCNERGGALRKSLAMEVVFLGKIIGIAVKKAYLCVLNR